MKLASGRSTKILTYILTEMNPKISLNKTLNNTLVMKHTYTSEEASGTSTSAASSQTYLFIPLLQNKQKYITEGCHASKRDHIMNILTFV